MRTAVWELSWLLSRDYAEDSALALVGNRHGLVRRQRTAVRRCACADADLTRRRQAEVAAQACTGRHVAIDGYNLLITVESALSGGVVLVGRDGCYRDLASLHGTYRRVEETIPALDAIAKTVGRLGIPTATWYLDRPVSNSGRLRGLILERLTGRPVSWEVELPDNPDPILAESEDVVVSSDSWILDRSKAWMNLAAVVIDAACPDAWVLDLRSKRESEEKIVP